MAFKEQRREGRYRVDMRCMVLPAEEYVSLLDVSLHGASILGAVDFSHEQHVEILFDTNDGKSIRVDGVVRNAIEVGNNKRYGVEIFTVPDEWSDLVYKRMLESK